MGLLAVDVEGVEADSPPQVLELAVVVVGEGGGCPLTFSLLLGADKQVG